MGGNIGLEDHPGIGSKFWFAVPLEAGKPRAPAAAHDPRLRQVRALVVDDSTAAGESITGILREWGVRAEAASRAETAVDMLAAAGPPGATRLRCCSRRTASQERRVRLFLREVADRAGSGQTPGLCFWSA